MGNLIDTKNDIYGKVLEKSKTHLENIPLKYILRQLKIKIATLNALIHLHLDVTDGNAKIG